MHRCELFGKMGILGAAALAGTEVCAADHGDAKTGASPMAGPHVHFWPDPKSAVPVGEPLLIWSLTGDGQCDAAVVAERDKAFGVDTAAVRARRGKELGLEVPQIPHPKSMDDLGRQWTASGDDKPTKM
jgi:Protein of unknown function (DUF1264)